MAGEPVGMGEEKHPKNGNSLLVTRSLNGQEVHTPLWINQFSTDIDIQVDTAQVRKGLVHRPLRFSERFLTFTTIWNVKDRPKYLKLGQKLREHWAFNMNETGKPTPMIFRYYGASKTWKGFIENWSTAFAITDVILSNTFSMRIITTPDKPIPASTRQVSRTGIPYAPTAGDVVDYGPEWMTGKYFNIANNLGSIEDSSTGPEDKKTKTSGTVSTTETNLEQWALERINKSVRWSPEDPAGYFFPIPGTGRNFQEAEAAIAQELEDLR